MARLNTASTDPDASTTKTVSARIPNDLDILLDTLALAEHKTVGTIVREALDHYFTDVWTKDRLLKALDDYYDRERNQEKQTKAKASEALNSVGGRGPKDD